MGTALYISTDRDAGFAIEVDGKALSRQIEVPFGHENREVQTPVLGRQLQAHQARPRR